jgi:molecular chaperone DnaK
MGTKHRVKIGDKKYSPEELSSMILRKIKEDSENFLSESIDKAVITVPAYFNDDQRQSTKDAGTIAGLEVVRIINEPTAASLAYGLDKEDADLKIVALDLGGGAFDVTIMQMGGGVFEVKSTSGDTQLGGTDMDSTIIDDLVGEFKKEHGIDLTGDKSAIQRIREAAEKAKIELTNTLETEINLPFISAGDSGPIHYTYKITRAKLEDLITDVLGKLKPPMRQSLKDAKLKKKEIDKVVLVGGPTRMPSVQKTFKDFFQIDPERGIDPMECVAMGAAIQGGVLSGDVKKDLVLLDVTPLSLGIETLGGVFTRLIDRNTIIPTKKSKVFSTASDNQPAVDINVLQGEREMAEDNKSLGKFSLVGIPPAPRGVPQVEVAFEIDANGILNVNAKDMATNNEQEITITGSSHLWDDDKERMIKEAETHAEEDKQFKEQTEIKNHADTLLHTVKRSMKEHEDKLDAKKRKDVDKAADALEKALKKDDIEKIKKKEEDLSKVSQDLFAAMYAEAAQQRMSEDEGEDAGEEEVKASGGKSKKKKGKKKKAEEDNVVDVDYEDVDEE